MTSKPMISVIMPAYNVEKYVVASIESILNQTFTDFELIIVDDCSTDGTAEIVNNYVGKDERIIFLKNDVNMFATSTRNRAIRIARGKYIAIQDSDDISFPNRLSEEFDYLEKHSDIYLLGSGATLINMEGKVIGSFHPLTDSAKIVEQLEKKNCIYHPTVMFRNDGTLYREKIYYAEDYDLYLNILSRGYKIAQLAKPLLHYRILSTAVSKSKGGYAGMFSQKVRDFYFERLKYGTDSYGNFDPKSILEMSPNSTNKYYLLGEMDAVIKVHNFKRVRELAVKYFRYHGFSVVVILYFLVSIGGSYLYPFLKRLRNFF
jgi:glycosyltransferase involved in cell wall biosynthesis